MMTDFIPMKCNKSYRISAMKRSGHHAVIVWLMHLIDKDLIVMHKNDIEEKKIGQNPYLLPPHLLPSTCSLPNNGNYLDRSGNFFYADIYLYNYEDTSPNRIFNIKNYKYNNSDIFDILILRDPYNMMASRLKCNFIDNKEADLPKTVDLWIESANLYLNYQRESLLYINYNKWFSDVEYRKYLSKILGWNFNDTGKNKVPGAGNGSSFDGEKYNNKAEKMDILNRYKEYMDNPLFIKYVLENKQLSELSDKIFGKIIK